MNIQNTEQLFMFEVAKALDAEQMISLALQQMIPQVENRTLKNGLTRHNAQTQEQIENLNKIFEAYDMEPQRIACTTAHAFPREYMQTLSAISDPELVDVATAMMAQRVEHHEIGMYRTLITLSEELGKTEFTTLLKENLQQEQKMAKTLEEFSERLVPAEA